MIIFAQEVCVFVKHSGQKIVKLRGRFLPGSINEATQQKKCKLGDMKDGLVAGKP
jgi:hypothetical protein